MKVILFCLLNFAFTSPLFAQKNSYFSVVFGGGASYFFNDNSFKRKVDNTWFAGINYTLKSKNQVMYFNPGLNILTNDYHSVISEKRAVHVSQNMLNLNLDILLRISKRILLRTGLLFNFHHETDILLSDKNIGGGFYYGSSDLYQNYEAANFQSGFTLGLSFPFKLFKREQKFNLKFLQIGSPLVTKDFYLSNAVVGKDFKVLSRKARPSMLTLSFDISLQRLKKKKKAEDEE